MSSPKNDDPAEIKRRNAAVYAMAVETGLYDRPPDYDPVAAARAGGMTYAELLAEIAEMQANEIDDLAD